MEKVGDLLENSVIETENETKCVIISSSPDEVCVKSLMDLTRMISIAPTTEVKLILSSCQAKNLAKHITSEALDDYILY